MAFEELKELFALEIEAFPAAVQYHLNNAIMVGMLFTILYLVYRQPPQEPVSWVRAMISSFNVVSLQTMHYALQDQAKQLDEEYGSALSKHHRVLAKARSDHEEHIRKLEEQYYLRHEADWKAQVASRRNIETRQVEEKHRLQDEVAYWKDRAMFCDRCYENSNRTSCKGCTALETRLEELGSRHEVELEKAKGEVEVGQAELIETIRVLQIQVADYGREMNNSEKKITRNDRALHEKERLVLALEERVAQGERSIQDLLNAKNGLENANNDLQSRLSRAEDMIAYAERVYGTLYQEDKALQLKHQSLQAEHRRCHARRQEKTPLMRTLQSNAGRPRKALAFGTAPASTNPSQATILPPPSFHFDPPSQATIHPPPTVPFNPPMQQVAVAPAPSTTPFNPPTQDIARTPSRSTLQNPLSLMDDDEIFDRLHLWFNPKGKHAQVFEAWRAAERVQLGPDLDEMKQVFDWTHEWYDGAAEEDRIIPLSNSGLCAFATAVAVFVGTREREQVVDDTRVDDMYDIASKIADDCESLEASSMMMLEGTVGWELLKGN